MVEEGATSIGSNAFYYNWFGFKNITSVSLPSTLKSIGERAFYDCDSLSSITIPNSVESINQSAFYNCTGLTSIVLPDSVTTLKESAFNGCTSLASVTLSNNLTGELGNQAFRDTAISSIVIPHGITRLGTKCFYNCTNLTTIYLPSTMSFTAGEIFDGSQLTDVYYAGTEEQWEACLKDVSSTSSNVTILRAAIIHYNYDY